MISTISLSQIAKDCDGIISGDARFHSVCTDSRKLQKGDLFLAIKGEHFDGNEFIEKAVESGAVAIVANRKPNVDIPYILAKDPRAVLGLIARHNRRQFSGAVIALTGSTGKTTCKEMLSAILSECGDVLATQGNFNNEVGVPLTLLEITDRHHSAVIEMGACRGGDIRYLCQFAEPGIGIVTNAMPAHIESFGDIETVAATKGEVFESAPADGIAIINLDDRFARQWLVQAGDTPTTTFSMIDSSADVFAKNVHVMADGSLEFVVCTAQGEQDIQLSLLGRHNVANALAACAGALAAGASLQQLKSGLANVHSVAGRLRPFVANSGGLVIDDSYNASPQAVRAAVDVMVDCSIDSDGNKRSTCLLLGTMNELGEQALQFHEQVCIYAREQGIDQLVAVGEYASNMVQAFAGKAVAFDNVDELLLQLDEHTKAEIVLVKGSRTIHMEKVVHALMDNTGAVNKNLGEH